MRTEASRSESWSVRLASSLCACSCRASWWAADGSSASGSPRASPKRTSTRSSRTAQAATASRRRLRPRPLTTHRQSDPSRTRPLTTHRQSDLSRTRPRLTAAGSDSCLRIHEVFPRTWHLPHVAVAKPSLATGFCDPKDPFHRPEDRPPTCGSRLFRAARPSSQATSPTRTPQKRQLHVWNPPSLGSRFDSDVWTLPLPRPRLTCGPSPSLTVPDRRPIPHSPDLSSPRFRRTGLTTRFTAARPTEV